MEFAFSALLASGLFATISYRAIREFRLAVLWAIALATWSAAIVMVCRLIWAIGFLGIRF